MPAPKGWRWVAGAVAVLTVATLSWTAPGTSSTAAAGEPAGPAVAHPWEPGRPQLGVQVYWVDTPTDGDDVVRRKARRVLDHVVGMEANAVSVSFPIFTDAIDADAVRTDGRTPGPERLAIVVREARALGLRTTVRPLLDEANLVARDSLDWRGRLDPADRDAWFASYRALLDPYLAMAERERVDTVVVAAELNAMQDDPGWGPLVEHVRTAYSGEVGYAANWDAYAAAVESVPVDVVGIDAYPQLGVAPTASVAEMTAAWRSWLDDAAPPRPGLLLYEVGAAAEARTVDNPAIPHRAGEPLDQGVQQRWLAASCAAARERGLAGLYLWKIEFDVDPAAADPAADLHDSFLGRGAERTMRDCFASWGAVR